jgi:hypothetical protein
VAHVPSLTDLLLKLRLQVATLPKLLKKSYKSVTIIQSYASIKNLFTIRI